MLPISTHRTVTNSSMEHREGVHVSMTSSLHQQVGKMNGCQYITRRWCERATPLLKSRGRHYRCLPGEVPFASLLNVPPDSPRMSRMRGLRLPCEADEGEM